MSFSLDEILSFATQIACARLQPWGKGWTTREIDGCFYYHFHNLKFNEALRNVRRCHLGQEEPPWPVRFDSQDLPWKLILASLGIRAMTLYDKLALDDIAERFGVDAGWLPATYLTGMPVPFCRYAIKIHTDNLATPIFRLDIFSRRVVHTDWSSIRQKYSIWLEVMELEKHKASVDYIVAQGERGRLHDVRGHFMEQGVPHVEILSYPPFASTRLFESAAKEYFDKEKVRLTGGGSTDVAIRAWTAYLLTELVGTTNRQAIAQTNEVLGQQCGTYAMNETLEGAEGHGGGVTSSGEIQFSRDKADLKERINYYDMWLAQADPYIN